MSRKQVTLRSGDAERYEALRRAVEQQRDGATPSNPEVLRLMMDQFDPAEI